MHYATKRHPPSFEPAPPWGHGSAMMMVGYKQAEQTNFRKGKKMPQGKGTYGKNVGRPPKKNKKGVKKIMGKKKGK